MAGAGRQKKNMVLLRGELRITKVINMLFPCYPWSHIIERFEMKKENISWPLSVATNIKKCPTVT